jgi:hypothetical protein
MMEHKFIIQANNELILLKKFMDRAQVLDLLKQAVGNDSLEEGKDRIVYNFRNTINSNRKYIIGFRGDKLDYVLRSN